MSKSEMEVPSDRTSGKKDSIIRSMTGWMGILCDEIMGTQIAREHRVPTHSELERAIVAAREMRAALARVERGEVVSEDMQEPKYRVEDLTQEQYDYLRGLVGWLGTLCDELTGSTCAHEGRPPTPDEVQAAQRRARHLSDEHRECWRQRYEDVLDRYTEVYDAYRFFCKQPPPTREDVLQSLGMEPEPEK